MSNLRQSTKTHVFLGIVEVPFKKGIDHETGLIGAVVKGSDLEEVLSGKVTVDGYDATDEIIKMVASSKYRPQIKAIFVKGLSVAGFNVIDIQRVYEITHIPVIVCIMTLPEINKIETALTKIGQPDKLEIYRKTQGIFPYTWDSGTSGANSKNIYLQSAGLDREDVKAYIKATCTKSHFPEPMRIAKIITHGLNPHISTKSNQTTRKKEYTDPEEELWNIIENYNRMNSPNRAEDLSGSDDVLIIADWVAKADRTLQPNIERLINIISLYEYSNDL